jgi:catabolite repression protein CreC
VRLNKGGCIISSPCTAVHWVPSSRNLFLVSHADGTIIVYDKEREDSSFIPRNPGPDPGDAPAPVVSGPPVTTTEAVVNGNTTQNGLASSHGSKPGEFSEWLPFDGILVTPGPSGFIGGGLTIGAAGKDKVLKNPVSHWRISRKSIYCVHLSRCPWLFCR